MAESISAEGEQIVFDRSKNGLGDELTHNEIWDDTLLIQRYDESMKNARKLLANKLSSASSVTDSDCSNSHRTELVNGFSRNKAYNSSMKRKKKKGRKKNEWHTGDPCRARYSEDGQIYEATIIGINNSSGTCNVKYIGYNNHEEVSQCSLLKSKGEGVRRRQMNEVAEAYGEGNETENTCSVDSDTSTENERQSSMMPPPKIPSKSSNFNRDRSPRQYIPHIPNLPPPPAIGLVEGPDKISSEALHTMLMSWYMTGYHTGFYQGLSQGKSNRYREITEDQRTSNNRHSTEGHTSSSHRNKNKS